MGFIIKLEQANCCSVTGEIDMSLSGFKVVVSLS